MDIFLHYRQFFIKGDFIIGRVECNNFCHIGTVMDLKWKSRFIAVMIHLIRLNKDVKSMEYTE